VKLHKSFRDQTSGIFKDVLGFQVVEPALMMTLSTQQTLPSILADTKTDRHIDVDVTGENRPDRDNHQPPKIALNMDRIA
jgi:hypothetical protein